MQNILYDTNALYDPATLRALAARPGVTMWACVTHVIETLSDIVDDRSFGRARSQLRTMIEISPRHFLPLADDQFRMALDIESNSDALEWRKYAEIVARAERRQEVEDELDLERARGIRREHGESFLGAIFLRMIPSIQPLANTSADRFNVKLSKHELRELESFLYSPDGRRAVTEGWIERQGWDRLVLPSHVAVRAQAVLDGYYLTYRGYVMNMFERNWRPRANDALDLDLTLPLALPNWILVTRDKRLLAAMERGGVPRAKFADTREIDPRSLGEPSSP